MDKRTKILLIVLVSLTVLAGGYFGFMYTTSGDELAAVATPPAPAKTAVAKKPAAKPAEPAPAAAAPEPAQAGAPATAMPAGQPASSPGVTAATPGAQQSVKPEDAAKAKSASPETKPVTAEAKPAAKPGEKPAPATKPGAKLAVPAVAPCVPVMKVDIKGKAVEFKTPEELVEKSGLDAKALGEYSAKSLDTAKKKLDGLTKRRAPAGDIECAKKELELADGLAKLVAAKNLQKPEKEVYTYSSLDKRDPFMSPVEIPKVFPKVQATASPMERVPSEQLKVEGIMWNQKGYRALVVTPDGRGYTVKPGDKVGNKGGKIVKISDKRVYIEERIPDIFGDIEVRPIVLKLYKEAE